MNHSPELGEPRLNEDALKKLRAPFAAGAVGKLPRVTCKDCSDRRVECQKHQRSKCNVCDNFISTAHIHLDYVGHAEVTDRLLSVDPEWNWEPVAFDAEGNPLVAHSADGVMRILWIRLTVCGVTRLGVGSVAGNAFDAEKQLIGDALRNAAMRFGVALDLWSKAELESALEDEPTERPNQERRTPAPSSPPQARTEAPSDQLTPYDQARGHAKERNLSQAQWRDVLRKFGTVTAENLDAVLTSINEAAALGAPFSEGAA